MLVWRELPNLLIGFSLLGCWYAFAKGGAPERLGASVIVGNLLVGMLNEHFGKSALVSLGIDAITALSLLGVALRYARPWLGVVLLLYALQFGLHAYYLVLERPRDMLHIVLNNADFLAVCLCLVVGTAIARRRRPPAGLAAP
jgi:hypothetical protein